MTKRQIARERKRRLNHASIMGPVVDTLVELKVTLAEAFALSEVLPDVISKMRGRPEWRRMVAIIDAEITSAEKLLDEVNEGTIQ